MTASIIWLMVSIGCFGIIIINLIFIIKKQITLIGLISSLVCVILLFIGSDKLADAIKDNGGEIVLSYNADATVIGIGSKGITVEYYEDDGYGEKLAVKKAKIVVSEDKYQVGDTITIQIYENIFLPEAIVTIKY